MSWQVHLVEDVVAAVALLEMAVPEWEQLGAQLVDDRAVIRGRQRQAETVFKSSGPRLLKPHPLPFLGPARNYLARLRVILSGLIFSEATG
jgi:hypothetical protein